MKSHTEIRLTVPGKPQARQAHHVFRRGDKLLKVMPKESASFQNLVSMCAAEAMQGKPPIENLVEIEIWFFFPAPKTTLSKLERAAIETGMTLKKPIRKDLDNLMKCVGDGLNGVALKDDSQIVESHLYKRLAKVPRTEISIKVIN